MSGPAAVQIKLDKTKSAKRWWIKIRFCLHEKFHFQRFCMSKCYHTCIYACNMTSIYNGNKGLPGTNELRRETGVQNINHQSKARLRETEERQTWLVYSVEFLITTITNGIKV